MPQRRTSILLVALFFLSGFLALVYQIVWIRRLALVFGSTHLATSVVLAVFFAGLALGSVLFGRMAERTRNLARLYGAIEAGIALWALGFPWLAGAADAAYGAAVSGHGGLTLYVSAMRILLGTLLLLPPTTLMGGTLPVLSRYFIASRTHLSRRLGGLYALNTLGAAAGVGVAGFFLLRQLGMSGTLWACGAVNLGAGLAAMLVPEVAGAAAPLPAREPVTRPSRRALTIAVAGFAVSGFTGLGYEVVWSRYLALFLTNSIYATTTVLTTFLAGLVAGTLVFSLWLDRRARLVEIFGWVQTGVGLASLVLLPVLTRASPPLERLTGNLLVYQFALAASLMAVPTVLAGCTFPLVGRIVTVHVSRVSSTVGWLYALNTAGAIVGALAAGFLLVPRLGVSGANATLAAVNLAAGIAALGWASTSRLPARLLAVVAIVAASFVARALFADPVPRTRLAQLAGEYEHVTAIDEGLVNTVWVTSDAAGRRALWTDRSVMGRTARTYRKELCPQRVQGHIPLLVHPGTPRRVLGIAFGTGQTFAAQLLYPIESLEAVDISRTVVDVSLEHFADVQGGLGRDPRVRVVLDDGRSFVDRSTESWDVVQMEMPPHQEAGIVHFYTLDFYRNLERRLAPDAVVAQWVPIYNISPDELASCARTFLEVFPNSALWYNSADLLLLGFHGPFDIDRDRLARRLAAPGVARDLDVSYLGGGSPRLNEVDGILAGLLLRPDDLRRLAAHGRLYTDDRPDLEFSWIDFPVWGADRHSRLVLANLDRLERFLSPDGDERVAAIRRAYLDQVRAAAFSNLAGLAAARRPDQAVALFRRALAYRPDFADAWSNLGSVLLDLGRGADALAAYDTALGIEPDLAEAALGRGDALSRLDRPREALEAWRAAARIRPHYPKAEVEIGNALRATGDPAGAEAAYRRAIDAEPIEPTPYLELARVLYENRRVADARAVIERAGRRFPWDRDVERARRILRRAVAHPPG